LTTYRGANFDDWEGVAALHVLSWRKAYRGALRDEFLDGPVVESRRERWETRLREPPENQFLVLAEEDAELVGFACAYGEHHEEWGVLLDNLHVHPDAQGGGIGRRLVCQVAAWAREKYPASAMYLEVLEVNQRARRFYERLGGTDAGPGVWDSPDGSNPAVRQYVWTRRQVAELADAVRE